MEFKELDHLFDEAIKRFDSKKPTSIDPYAQGPQSADHFLLKKSWDYFKERVRTIESHCDEIVKAKEIEIQTLNEELALVREQLSEAELKNQMLDKFEEEVRATRSKDFIDFQKLSERLKQAWEEEQQNLSAQLSAVEFALQSEKEKNKALSEEMVKRARAAAAGADALKEENAKLVQKHFEDKKASQEVAGEKDGEIVGRESKIDLLKSEVERRDLLLQKQKEDLDSLGTKVDALLLRIKQTDEAVADRDGQIKYLAADVERIEYEKESLKKAWESEQAQWRELWERSRQLWDKQD